MLLINSFLFCGFICLISQIILDNTKLTPGHITSMLVVLGAFFMATDYAVVPKDKMFKYVYAVGIGFVTVLIWKFGNYSLAIYYAIIIVGLLCSALTGIIRSFKGSKVR